jgi:hypothetical protein
MVKKIGKRTTAKMTLAQREEVAQKIMTAVGKPVNFTYPGDEGHKHGILKERVVIFSSASGEVPYWDVVDLIEFPGEHEPKWIRIGYYRQPKKKLVWASQTTITEPVTVWKELLIHAAKEKGWFRKLLKQVVAKLPE